ncbi:uncharacterized protein LOC108251357 [Kryptolebias marmoratus]|uniref:uncharacterized protein LOC108251357 n=1 Tax=Kryptolebias marmoratus TaxID=37003 RepID=UPI0007F8A2CC|nr:uncharacterized protein LOC108251357 [Kryptolebias marmoratus]XP_017297107.1 uncharacterized protein LOC108251357 [Kryptolebias marmoratus]XP_037830878.1 uncharacterized protein LOC108251357 [Kryptolebias marmoratus]
MAFSNLFSKLAAIHEDVRSPGRPDFTFRSRTENHGGTRGRKRKTQAEQHDSYRKKRCYEMASGTNNSPAQHHQKQNTESRYSPAEGTRTNPSFKPDYNKTQSCDGLNSKTSCNVKKKKKRQKRRKMKHEQCCRYRERSVNREKRYLPRKDRRNEQDKPRFMTQEFKEQNALLVDGRLVCRHFLNGRCIKEDRCQLLHIQGCNNMIKEACKFYIQGFCLNGESCIYMHKSIPCKFFHRKGKCVQEANCRFSHDPLNDVTEKLLDEMLRQEKMYYEGTKEDKEEETEANKNPDLTEPLRPSFYNSANTEKEANPRETGGSVSESAEPHGSPSDDPNHQEPVCYSVEAVLGPQLSRTFSSFSKTPRSQESSSFLQTSSDQTVSFSKQNEVPYSVDSVLRSWKSVENSNFGPTPSFSTTFYNPRMVSGAVKDPQIETISQNAKCTSNRSQENMSRSFLSYGAKADVISDASSDAFLSSEDPKKQEVKLELSATSRSKESTNLLTGTSSETSAGHPPSPPSAVNEFKGKVAASAEPLTTSVNKSATNVAVHHFAVKQLVEILQNSKKKLSAVKPAASKIPPKSWSKPSHQAGLDETQKSLFSRRSANSPTDCVTPSAPAPSQSFVKPERSAGIKGSSSAFLCLFATPLSASLPSFQFQTSLPATPPCSQRSAETPKPDPEPTDSCFKSISSGLRTEGRLTPLRQTSPATSRSLKTESAAVKQEVTPVSGRSESCGEPLSGQAEQQPSDVSSPRETASDSVLKTLFLHLKPYQEDGEHQDRRQSFVHPDGEKEERSSTENIVFTQPKKRKKKNLLAVAPQAPQSCSESPGRSAVTCPGTAEPRVMHGFPSEAGTRHSRLAKPPSMDGDGLNGNAVVTPFRDLFKSLDAAVFHDL